MIPTLNAMHARLAAMSPDDRERMRRDLNGESDA
jgi:hypothetical protein